MRKKYFNLLFFIVCYHISSAQCISGDCGNGKGVYSFSAGSSYDGEWKNGSQNGKGKYTYKNGDVYDGNWLNGKHNGFGKYTYHEGSYYEGNYKNGVEEGDGKYVSPNGDIQTGYFVNGFLNGKGTILFKNGDKYTGVFVNDKLEGKATIEYANGDRFEGQFKNNQRNGAGILFFPKGGTLKGEWKDGEYVRVSNMETVADNSNIKLLRSGGVWEVPVLINGVLKLPMIFDSGASEVFLTPQVVLTLYNAKTISNKNILNGGAFITANGVVDTSVRFSINELNIGGQIIRDIPAAVSTSVDGMNLLGLSALEKLGKIEIDFLNGTIKTK